MSRPTIDDFPGAPPSAHVCEEGWLILGEEAWTVEEWRSGLGADERAKHGIHVKIERRRPTEEERQAARRETKRRWIEANRERLRRYNREYMRRKRGSAA